jgi:uncharacterized protein Yka (UPF0111/DUF47 family)
VSLALREHPAVGLVVNIAANVERTASLFLDMMADCDPAQVYEILERERVGDELARDLFTFLESDLLVTDALARDDIRDLAGVLEDALDAVAAAADGVRLYRLRDPLPEVHELAQKLARGAALMHEILPQADSRGDVRRAWLRLTRLEDDGEACAAAVRARAGNEQSASLSRWRDISDLLEEALHDCQHGAAILVASVLQAA